MQNQVLGEAATTSWPPWRRMATVLEPIRPVRPITTIFIANLLVLTDPGSLGVDFQRELAAKGIRIPIVFITGHGDIPMSVRAMKAGAVEFLTKPFRDQDLLDAIRVALERDRARREQEKEATELQQHFGSLTPREQEVISLVASGMLNKQIAGQLGTAENTVKVHRSRAMEKMRAQSLADLVRMIEKVKGRSQTAA